MVLVTNRVYATGGKVMAGDLTNRVAIDKAITVQDCEWLGGDTNSRGKRSCHERAGGHPLCLVDEWSKFGWLHLARWRDSGGGDQFSLRSGGGIWASSTNAMVSNCLLVENAAHYGGGAYRGWLADCTIKLNFAEGDGGGGCSNVLYRCSVVKLGAKLRRWGAGKKLPKCIFNSNLAFGGGGAYGARVFW